MAYLAEKSAQADEKLDSINNSLNDLKQQSEKQDGRLWLLVTGLFLTLLGAVAKIVFFPNPWKDLSSFIYRLLHFGGAFL